MAARSSLILGACLAALGLSAQAEGIYRYVEKDGTIVYTNVAPPKGTVAKRLKGTFHKPPSLTDSMVARSDKTDFEEHIESAARRYRIPVALVRAIIQAESNFDPQAVSGRGASGLMQLMPATAEQMYVKDIFDPRDNIEGATRYLRTLANLYDGDMVRMIAAYNAGPEAVKKYGGDVPPFPETQAYVRKVLALYFQFKGRYRLAQEGPR